MKRKMRTATELRYLAAVGLAALFVSISIACGSDKPASTPIPTAVPSPALSVVDAWARPSSVMAMDDMDDMDAMDGMDGGMDTGREVGSGVTSAVYMTLVNDGGLGNSLVSVTNAYIETAGDLTDTIELHESTMNEGVMAMSPVTKITVPANGEAVLEPGGLHVMMFDLRRNVNVGDSIKLTLEFETSESITISAEVRVP